MYSLYSSSSYVLYSSKPSYGMSENEMTYFELQLVYLDNLKIDLYFEFEIKVLQFWIAVVPGVVEDTIVRPAVIWAEVVWPNIVSPAIIGPAVVGWAVVWPSFATPEVLGSAIVGPDVSHVIVEAIVIVTELKEIVLNPFNKKIHFLQRFK